jgi:hypothetical protein
VVTADSADECLSLHEEINRRIARGYGVSEKDFASHAEQMDKILYPDQQVYLTLTDTQREILIAITFIHTVLRANGETAQSMDANATDFIKNWESEAYRKTILQ